MLFLSELSPNELILVSFISREPQTLRFAFSDSCDTKHVQIHKHSHDNTSDSTAFNKNKVDFNEGPSSENFHESELAENKHGLAFEVRFKRQFL